MSLTAKNIAEYFLVLADEDAGDLISNLKLQKLCYFAQGFHLAIYNRPLFEEKIEAWMHGPVVTKLYHEYKSSGNGGIPKPENMDFSLYDEETREFLDEIYSVYGQYSAWKLRNLTHEDKPWRDAYDAGGTVISINEMKKWFKNFIEDE